MIRRFRHAAYALPLRAPLPGSGERTRRGLLLELGDGEGHSGWGEIAPLPGWHRETLEQVEILAPDLGRALARGGITTLDDARRALAGTAAAAMPSVVFGVEMAWLGLQARRRGVVPARVLCAEPAASVPVAALVGGEVEAPADAPAVKVKVGRHPESENEELRALLGRLPAATRLRLDGNRGCTLAQAHALLDGLDPARIEFFEEPLREPAELPELHRRTGVALALDETLREPRRQALWSAPGVTTWVLKPALHGAIAGALRTAEKARAAGIGCVVSSCFESGLGLWALAQLAACVQEPGVAAGLGTGAWLATDLVEPPFAALGSAVATEDWVGAP